MTPQRFASGRFGGVARLPGHQVGRVISNLFGGGSARELLDSAPFCSELLYTAIPQRAASGTTGTFTRATTSTWQNNDGYMVTGVAGEIGFPGARRVANKIAGSSEDFSNAAWTAKSIGGAAAPTVTANQAIAPDGTMTASLITGGTSYPAVEATSTVAYTAGVWILSLYVKKGVGEIVLGFSVDGGDEAPFDTATGLAGSVGANISDAGSTDEGDYWRFYAVSTRTAVAKKPIIYNGFPTASSFYIWGAQLEDVTAQTTQTAGEYVSVGVESAPYYHGSMVDGVKCFPTDISGNPLTGMLGYQAQGARTNLCLRSGTIYPITYAAAWAASGSITVTEAARIAPDGTVTATRVQTTGASSLNSAAITVTASTAYVFSFWALNNSGTDAKYRVYNNTGAADIVTQTTYLSSINNATWVRISVAFTTPVGCVSISVYPHSTGASGGDLYVWGAQLETGSFASSYIATTTIAVTRNADVLTYSSAGNIDGTKGWCYAEVAANWSASPTDPKAIAAFQSSIDYGLWYLTSANNLTLTDGAAAAGAEKSFTILPTAQKVAATWSSAANSSLGAAQGVAGGADTFGTAFAPDQIGVGIYRNGTVSGEVHWFGTIRNVRIGQRQLSASELGAITS